MNIVLTGLRGSGKTKIGRILAEKLKWNFADIDEEIEKKEKKCIAEIVNLKGWEYFRAVEKKITQKIAELDKTVIATGGGTILDDVNLKALKKKGKFIYLYEKPEICAKRILKSKNRPSLTKKESVEEEIKELYKQRNEKYCRSAFLIFHRSESLKKDAKEIIKSFT